MSSSSSSSSSSLASWSWQRQHCLVLVSLFLVALVVVVDAATCGDEGGNEVQVRTIRKKVQDTTIFQNVPDLAEGSTAEFVRLDLDEPDGSGAEVRGLLKFSKLSLKKGRDRVERATLRFRIIRSSSKGSIVAHRLESQTGWKESEATWNSMANAAVRPEPSFSLRKPSKKSVTIDVTEDVTAWHSGGSSNGGWMLSTDSVDGFDFDSSEASKKKKRPSLRIEYCFLPTEPPPPPPSPTPPFMPPSPTTSPVSPALPTPPTTSPISPTLPTPPTASPIGRPPCQAPAPLVLQGGLDTAITEHNPTETGNPFDESRTVDAEDPDESQALLKFTSLPSQSGGDGRIQIQQATLQIRTIGSGGQVQAFRMLQDWQPLTATWQSFGGNGIQFNNVEARSTPTAFFDTAQENVWQTLDVSADVQEWFSNGNNNGWVFATQSTDGWDFVASQSNDIFLRPTLTVDFVCNDNGEEPTPPSPTPPSPSPNCFNGRQTEIYQTGVDTLLDEDNPFDTGDPSATSRSVDAEDPEQTQVLLQFTSTLEKLRVLEATLQLYTEDPSSTTSGIRLHRMISSWTPQTATWNSFGGNGVSMNGQEAAGGATAVFFPDEAGQFVTLNVAADVQEWVSNNSNRGWVIWTQSSDGYDVATFQASNPLERPQLTVVYDCSGDGGGGPSPNPPTESPPPVPPVPLSYIPGEFQGSPILRDINGRTVSVSVGLTGRAVAYTGQRVPFANGGFSSRRFHSAPDAAAVFKDPNGGYVYTSNAEVSSGRGGVFSLKFDDNHNVVDYFPVLQGTTYNCGGGRTPWNTWLTCEENGRSGRVWQVDPLGRITAQGNRTEVAGRGGTYESVAYHMVTQGGETFPVLYLTEDTDPGAVVRFVPDAAARACYARKQWCALESGSHSYLRLLFQSRGRDAGSGTFTFGSERDANGDDFPFLEGIDVRGNTLYFVSKAQQRLYILELDQGTFTYSSTDSGAFNREPDQVRRILGEDGIDEDNTRVLYFAEDGGNDCGVHARSADGRFYTILDGTGYSTESTGLAFSPDGRVMFVAFQIPGVIWQFWRLDGRAFGGQYLDIKYHAV